MRPRRLPSPSHGAPSRVLPPGRILLHALACLALVTGACAPRKVAAPSSHQDLDDLYAVWQDEIQANHSGNVYAGLGNRLQLDGEAYNYLFRALTALDRLRTTEHAPDFAGKAESVDRQSAATRKLFDNVRRTLPWPRYRITLSRDRIDLDGPERLELHEAIPERVLFTLVNRTEAALTVDVAAEPFAHSRPLRVPAGSERHFVGVVPRPGSKPADMTLRVVAGQSRLERTIPIHVAATGILELNLSHAGKAAAARVRVTGAGGRYLPPEAHEYGLIVKMFGPEHSQVAQRWFYSEGSSRVRVPAGTVNVSIRKGLEFKNLDLQWEVPAGATVRKSVELTRWIDMGGKGWRSGDIHLHYFSPPSIRFEMEAEDLALADILVMNEYGATIGREHFRGAPDPICDPGHIIYYDEEFRHEELGHLALLNLKSLVEPISIGHLGAPHAQIYRGTHFRIVDEPRKPRADNVSPDRLLIDAMRETHRQGGFVNWAHLRDELEFPLDAALGQLDAVDIITDTKTDEAQLFWYSLLNCGIRLPATAGTDRSEAHIPVGHQRTYARLPFPFTHAQWMDAIRRGASFVTNGPMVELTVDGKRPGDDIALDAPKTVRIVARAESQLPFDTLDVVANGKVIRSSKSVEGRRAEMTFDYPIGGSVWIAARALGARHPELMFYPHPDWSHRVVAHTSPLYANLPGSRIAHPDSARFLLDRLQKLDAWARNKAYFGDDAVKDQALRTIDAGIEFYRRIVEAR